MACLRRGFRNLPRDTVSLLRGARACHPYLLAFSVQEAEFPGLGLEWDSIETVELRD